MSDPSPISSPRDRITAEAAAWVLRTDRGLTAQEQDDLSSWLAANPQHGRELARVRRYWSNLDVLAGWRPEHATHPNPDLLKRRARHKPAWATFALVGAALAAPLVVGLAVPLHQPSAATARIEAPPMIATLASTAGPRRLEDGSIANLNEGADLLVDYTATERRVRLLRGEAHFAVRKDSSRPFIVEVGGLDVRAVGTAFNVRFASTEVEVLVTEGHVQVDAPKLAAPATPRATAEIATEPTRAGVGQPLVAELAPRQRAVIPLTRSSPPQIATLTAGEIERVLSWQERMLEFNATPLSDVVVAFNRRNVTQLVVVDAQLGAQRISGSFRADNVAGLIHLLEAGFGARAEQRGDEILLRLAR